MGKIQPLDAKHFVVSVTVRPPYSVWYAYCARRELNFIVDERLVGNYHADGYKALLYIDSETYLTYKVKAKALGQTGLEVESETFLSDYKEVDGVMLAHSMAVLQDGAEYMNFITTEVIFNSGLEDSLFKMEE